MLHIVTIHGINTYRPDYSQPLLERLCASDPHREGHAYNWGHYVFDPIMAYDAARIVRLGTWWKPWSWAVAAALNELDSAISWVRAYEDPDIRTVVLGDMKARISHLAASGHALAFIGHSLGSVILVELLAEMIGEQLIQPSRIRAIVTMGSPLRIWKAPRRLQSVLRAVAWSSVGQWVNLWDRDDPVAGGLHRFDNRIKDIEVQTGGLARSHTSYWDSEAVAERIEKALA